MVPQRRLSEDGDHPARRSGQRRRGLQVEGLPQEVVSMSGRVVVDDAEDRPAEVLVEARTRLEGECIELRVRAAVLAPECLRRLEQTAPVSPTAQGFVDPEDRDVETSCPRAAEHAAADGAVLVAQDDRHRGPVRDPGPSDVPEVEPGPDVARLGRVLAVDPDELERHAGYVAARRRAGYGSSSAPRRASSVSTAASAAPPTSRPAAAIAASSSPSSACRHFRLYPARAAWKRTPPARSTASGPFGASSSARAFATAKRRYVAAIRRASGASASPSGGASPGCSAGSPSARRSTSRSQRPCGRSPSPTIVRPVGSRRTWFSWP